MNFEVTSNTGVHTPKNTKTGFYTKLGQRLAAVGVVASIAIAAPAVMHMQDQKASEAAQARVAMVQALRDSFKAPECLQNAKIACTVEYRSGGTTSDTTMVAYDARGKASFLLANGDIKQYPNSGVGGEQTITTPVGYSITTNRHGDLLEVTKPDGSLKTFNPDKEGHLNDFSGLKG